MLWMELDLVPLMGIATSSDIFGEKHFTKRYTLPNVHCSAVYNSQDMYVNERRTAAAAAKSLQSCLTLCDSIERSPPVSPVPGILQARILEWVAISFSNA